jgi:hypothetical protein
MSYLKEKVAAPVYKTKINDRKGSAALTTGYPYIRKSWHKISSTSGGRSVGIVRLRAKGHGVVFFMACHLSHNTEAVHFSETSVLSLVLRCVSSPGCNTIYIPAENIISVMSCNAVRISNVLGMNDRGL